MSEYIFLWKEPVKTIILSNSRFECKVTSKAGSDTSKGERQNLCNLSSGGWVVSWRNPLPKLLTGENWTTCLTSFLVTDNQCLRVSPWLAPLFSTCSLQCWQKGCENSGLPVQRQRWGGRRDGVWWHPPLHPFSWLAVLL